METTINEAAVVFLREKGFALPNIRRALIKLAGKTEPKLAEACGVTRATVAAHIRGGRANLGVQALLAQEREVRPEVLFEGWAELREKTGAVLRPADETRACETEAA